MAYSFNAAYRLLKFREKIKEVSYTDIKPGAKSPNEVQFADALGYLYDIQVDSAHDLHMAVSEILKMLDSQAKWLEAYFQDRDAPDEVYVGQIRHLRSFFGPARVINNMTQVVKLADGANLEYTLRIWAEFIDEDEGTIDPEDLQGLSELLDHIELMLAEGVYPEVAVQYVLAQFSIMKRALRDYDLCGVAAFNEAWAETQTHYFRNQLVLQDIARDEDKEGVEEFGSTMSWVHKWFRRTVQAAEDMQKLGQGYDQLKGLLGS